MIITDGNISIDSSLTDLDGLFVSNGTFTTESAGEESDVQINITGSITAWDGINLERDLPDNSSPAEKIIYSPKNLLLPPSSFTHRKTNWEEVSP